MASTNGDSNDHARVFLYDEAVAGTPLYEDGTGIVDITGSDGQEDEVARSLITANHTVGTDVEMS